jgi:hypothetical protein
VFRITSNQAVDVGFLVFNVGRVPVVDLLNTKNMQVKGTVATKMFVANSTMDFAKSRPSSIATDAGCHSVPRENVEK